MLMGVSGRDHLFLFVSLYFYNPGTPPSNPKLPSIRNGTIFVSEISQSTKGMEQPQNQQHCGPLSLAEPSDFAHFKAKANQPTIHTAWQKPTHILFTQKNLHTIPIAKVDDHKS